jgi:hypothetical protein
VQKVKASFSTVNPARLFFLLLLLLLLLCLFAHNVTGTRITLTTYTMPEEKVLPPPPSPPPTDKAGEKGGRGKSQPPRLRRLIATHHKTGTALMHDIFKTIAGNFSGYGHFADIRDMEDHPGQFTPEDKVRREAWRGGSLGACKLAFFFSRDAGCVHRYCYLVVEDSREILSIPTSLMNAPPLLACFQVVFTIYSTLYSLFQLFRAAYDEARAVSAGIVLDYHLGKRLPDFMMAHLKPPPKLDGAKKKNTSNDDGAAKAHEAGTISASEVAADAEAEVGRWRGAR